MGMRLPNGYGSVFKLSGKRRKPWVARKTIGFNEKGHPIYFPIGYFKNSGAAHQALGEYNADPYDLANRDLTFDKLYDAWIKRKYTDKGKTVMGGYRAARNACSEKFRNMKFIDIRTTHMEKELDDWDIGHDSKRNMKILFGQLFAMARENNIVKTDYSEFVKLEAPVENNAEKLHKSFTVDELKVLWANADDESVQLVLIYCYTGLRPGELIDIETGNVHLADRYMIGGIKTAAGINRVIPINEKIYKFIESRYNPDNKFLMIGRDGRPLNYYRLTAWYWNPVMKKFNLDNLPHDGRHTCATLLDNVVANKLLIKKILGHAVDDITEKTYTHKTIKQLVETINMI